MKINANEIRTGNVISVNESLWRVIQLTHTKPGKGGAYLQVELRGIGSGTKLNERFRVAEKVELVHTEERTLQFLYADEDNLFFMDPDNYQQITLDKELAGDAFIYMHENLLMKVQFCDAVPVGVILPDKVQLEVQAADAIVKKQTASGSYKPATMTNGLQMMVPGHVSAGDILLVSTKDGSYCKKVEK